MDDWGSAVSQRVVLGRKDDYGFVDFQWTGNEPEGLSNPEQAVALGAEWDGDELVTYNIGMLEHNFSRIRDGWLEDSD